MTALPSAALSQFPLVYEFRSIVGSFPFLFVPDGPSRCTEVLEPMRINVCVMKLGCGPTTGLWASGPPWLRKVDK